MNVVYENKTSLLSYSIDNTLSSTAHLHKELEVIYVKSGRAVAFADKNSYLLEEGDLFFTFPNQVHYYETLKSGSFMVLIFSPNIIYGEASSVLKSVPDSNYVKSGDSDIKDIFDRIYSSSGNFRMLEINGYMNILMSKLLPKLKLKTVTEEKNSAFHSIVSFCSENFRENITLDYVAESLHLSKYYISRLINSKLHQSFSDYISNLRISEACTLLKETDTKIADISEDVGFGTIRSFNRSFKQLMGTSPAEYRNQISALKKST